ncbi:MAG: polysaccharide export protein [Candidatus Magnetominusculus sp. LBB02]|nr:polysaccharide export protein [Candidatus Magnetominusculus sp. LBB02]
MSIGGSAYSEYRILVKEGGQPSRGIARKGIIVFGLLCVLMAIASCGGGSVIRTELPKGNATVEIQAVFTDNETPDYLIQTGDKLEIKFLFNPDLNATTTVLPDGTISLQFVGRVKAVGLTSEKLDEKLSELFADHIAHPEINVNIVATPNQRVFVDGEVVKKGAVVLPGRNISVLQAITEAGGVNENGKEGEILVIRWIGEQKYNIFQVDLEKIKNGTDMNQNIKLRPLDIVYVPRTNIAKVNQFVDQYLRKMLFFSTGMSTSLQTITP